MLADAILRCSEGFGLRNGDGRVGSRMESRRWVKTGIASVRAEMRYSQIYYWSRQQTNDLESTKRAQHTRIHSCSKRILEFSFTHIMHVWVLRELRQKKTRNEAWSAQGTSHSDAHSIIANVKTHIHALESSAIQHKGTRGPRIPIRMCVYMSLTWIDTHLIWSISRASRISGLPPLGAFRLVRVEG